MRTLTGLFLVVALAGCYSVEDAMDYYAEKCLKYGFTAGTVQHSECVQRETIAWQDRNNRTHPGITMPLLAPE
jgi:hypothetical protein